MICLVCRHIVGSRTTLAPKGLLLDADHVNIGDLDNWLPSALASL